ncbi:SHOCT domain-containing protein [Halorussus lipolyticus]|uniref:SHOCT domain-containing protein n=1 Tax=Halorussus lipolyticus TaxID=3034024 RepID=UPI0023E76B44|nr:SHOCT domain-containing protein [Halorussus sp. DT80]
MGLADDPKVKLLASGFALSLFALVGLVGFGLVAGLSTLAGPPAGASLVFAVLSAVAPYLVASALVGMLSLFLLVGLVVTAVRSASVPRSNRLARLARLVERYSSEARELRLSERLEPTTEDRIDQLKREYVEGDITELEYERRLQDLMADDSMSDQRVRREYERTDRNSREREFEW